MLLSEAEESKWPGWGNIFGRGSNFDIFLSLQGSEFIQTFTSIYRKAGKGLRCQPVLSGTLHNL